MEVLMNILISVLIVIIGTTMLITGSWLVHMIQNNSVIGEVDNCFKVNYDEFKRIFDKYKDEFTTNSKFPNSLFGSFEKHYIHADIIKINNNLYYLKTPVDYILAKGHCEKYAKEITKVKSKFRDFKEYEKEL